ncbi:MAG: hypothetical protein CMP08_07620 [Xanthomonadales bacterium]|nr:hypothetical protein [Xanthomonadales bacterium]|tara:strand:- start:37 stop:525 length:489 start_codon:yes stop_codon:yes gene_type:complete
MSDVAIATIRSTITETLQGIPAIGRVHDYERYASAKADLKALYEYEGQIRGWFVRRAGAAETMPDTRLGRTAVDNRWQIRGYMSLADAEASERAFDALVATIQAAFRTDETLGGVVNTTFFQDRAGIQVDDLGPVLFAGVLCHGARLSLRTRHWITGLQGTR